jgi:hypothetical protein
VTTLRLTARLARRLARSRDVVRSSSVVLVVAAFVVTMYIALATLMLSGEQVAARDLGRFAASAGNGSFLIGPGDERAAGALLSDVRSVAPETQLLLYSTGIQLAGAKPREVTLVQMDWRSSPFPGRYRLLQGRWPARPGEVVLTEPSDLSGVTGAGEPGDTLPVMGGLVRWKVVGFADDRFARTTNVLAAPGTWAALPAAVHERFPVLEAQGTFMWGDARHADLNGGRDGAVLNALTAAVEKRQPPEGDPGTVAGSLITRAQLLTRPEKTALARSPAGYTVPSFLLPAVAVLLAFGMNERRHKRTVRSLVSTGIRPVTAVVAAGSAVTAWCVGAAVAGSAVGVGGGFLARAVISRFRDLPAGPIIDLASPFLRLLVVTLATGGAAIGFFTLAGRVRGQSGTSSTTEPTSTGADASRLTDARHILAALAWGAGIVVVGRLDSPADAMVLTGALTVAMLLSLPDLIRALVAVLPEAGPRQRLARRQFDADRRRMTALVAVLTVLLGCGLGFVTLIDTLSRTLDAQSYPDALPGQLIVADRSSINTQPPKEVLAKLDSSTVLTHRPQQQLHFVATVREGVDHNVIVVDSVSKAAQLADHPLSRRQVAVLNQGGILLWSDADPPATDRTDLAVKDVQAERVVTRASALPTASVPVATSGWRAGSDGMILMGTAQRFRMPMTDGCMLYTGLSDDEARGVQRSLTAAGLDAKTVQIYTRPAPAVPSAALAVTAIGLLIITLLTTVVAVHGQIRVLRRYLGQLVTIGISPSWARHVLIYQLTAAIVLATVLGLVIATVPTVLLAYRISGFLISIPWEQLIVLLVTLYAALLLTGLRAARRLSPRDRLG